MRVLIAGGSGMIGKALAKSLLADDNRVFVLTRHPDKTHLPEGAQSVEWDGQTMNQWGHLVNEVEAVVNLVGERLSKWPWTKAQKQHFVDSRVNGGKALAEAIGAATRKPRAFLQASGINFYGPRGLAPVTEADAGGEDFLADLSRAWEGSTEAVEGVGVRRVVIRSAIVLDPKEGILPIMMLPARLFAGGRLGHGRQGLPWIHLEDEVRAIRFLLENESASGVFNLTSPQTISSAEFLRVTAKVLKRPYWLPVPAFAMRIVLGQMATLVLDGMYALPVRLQEMGFKFRFETAEAALKDLLGKKE